MKAETMIVGFLALLAVTLAVPANAGSNVPQSTAAPVASAPADHFDVDAATAAYMSKLAPAAEARADAYAEGGYWLLLWDFLIGTLVAWLILSTRLSAGMRDVGERIARIPWLQVIFLVVQSLALLLVLPITLLLMLGKEFRAALFKLPGGPGGFRWPQTLLYVVQYVFIITVVTLPWNAYEDYFREHQYGMSNLSMGAWMGEQFKTFIVTLILAGIALVIIYAVVRKTPRTWWLWGSLVSVALLIFAVAIAPVYLEPVFNRFHPLPDSPVKQAILTMARANAVPADNVYEFDASKQTKHISAHVSGIFGSSRIAVNDNLMDRGSPEEIEAVVGHEMGHYVMDHIYVKIFEIGVIIVVGFAFLQWAFSRLQARHGTRWGIRDVGDVAALPLMSILIFGYFFVLTPVSNNLSREIEAQADTFGLTASRQPDGFAQASLDTSDRHKLRPGAFEEFMFYDHPSPYQRIHRAMVWKAEHINDCDIVAYDATHQPPGMPVQR